jgi:hypothetical protein
MRTGVLEKRKKGLIFPGKMRILMTFCLKNHTILVPKGEAWAFKGKRQRTDFGMYMLRLDFGPDGGLGSV